ncbi:uncharacterized protein LOC112148682 isoform X1 [Oryzias melastigma]|uniref:uncharacterized protein LOC112148682 isoform X1 n=1 Tax=Oryzias melastigma TaxID=30732 RepID=UPI000CF831D4|nr:uncharacterized protein LOC112148682 isoform X1 [Oryzias melastigma]
MDELHLSYSGLWAKKYLTDTLKCQIMCLDKGDDAGEVSRTEDSEPLPATLDPWAQGCLPVMQSAHMSPQEDEYDSHQVQVRSSWPVSNRLTSSFLLTNEKGGVSLGISSGRPSPIGCTQRQEVQTDQIQVQTVSSEKKPSNASLLCLTSSLLTEKPKTTMKHARETQHHRISQCPPQKLDQKKKQGANLFPKADANKLLPPIPYSSERKDVEAKRKSTEQTVLKHKNVSGNYLKGRITPSRLDHSCLPQKWICPQYEIVENIHTKQKPSRETRQESKLSKHSYWTTASLKPLTSSRNQLEKSNLEYGHLPKHEKEPNMTSNVVRINKTVLAKGASLIDSQSVEINPQTRKRPTEPTKLKPIQNHPAVPLLSVEQVAKVSPQVNPLFQS